MWIFSPSPESVIRVTPSGVYSTLGQCCKLFLHPSCPMSRIRSPLRLSKTDSSPCWHRTATWDLPGLAATLSGLLGSLSASKTACPVATSQTDNQEAAPSRDTAATDRLSAQMQESINFPIRG